MGVSSNWPKVRALSKMHGFDQTSIKLEVCVYVTKQRCFIGYEYEVKLCVVFLYDVGMYQSVFTCS